MGKLLKKKKYPKGNIEGVHESAFVGGSKSAQGMSKAGHALRGAQHLEETAQEDRDYRIAANDRKSSTAQHKQNLKELRKMKGPTSGKSGFAKGGEVEACEACLSSKDGGPCPECSMEAAEGAGDSAKELELIKAVLGKRKMSQGGVVANEQGPGADELPNEFDYLALSGGLEDNSGPGNEHGDSSLFEDTVSRIMLKRKKQHNPSPA